MKSKFISFFTGFSIYTAIIVLISLSIQTWVSSIAICDKWPMVLLFLYLFTLLATFILIKYINTNRISHFANAFMLVNFGKLILYTLIIVVYAWFYSSNAIPFTITFFIYYLLLTGYEVVSLLKIQRKD